MTIVAAVLYALALAATPSPLPVERGELGHVPLHYGAALYLAATHHGLDPWTAGALLLAEHRGRDFSPDLRGRYLGGGELGLFQLKRVWAPEASERCNASMRATHHRYAGLRDCLFIGPGSIVVHDDHPPSLRRLRGAPAFLSNPFVNLEAGVIAFVYLRARWVEQGRFPWDWRAMFRCAPVSWRLPGNAPQIRLARKRCAASVARVEAWERALTGR